MGQKNENKNGGAKDLSAAPSVKSQFMKLAAEVHADIARIKQDSGPINIKGETLFNESPAIRKLVVFLATSDLKGVELPRIKKGSKAQLLLEVALQPQMQRSLPHDMHFEQVKNEGEKSKIGYKRENARDVVYFSGEGTFYSNAGLLESATQKVENILVSVIDAVKLISSENGKIKKSLLGQSGKINDVADLDDETKENIKKVLESCLQKKVVYEKNVSQNDKTNLFQAVWRVFLSLFLSNKNKEKSKPLKLARDGSKDLKKGAEVLSNFFENKKGTGNRGGNDSMLDAKD